MDTRTLGWSESVRVEIIPGSIGKTHIDRFYLAQASKSLARDTDTFFVAVLGDELIGAVRYCIENETPMLRSMMIHEDYRRRSIGRRLLRKFEDYLDARDIHDVYCLPYSHLVRFYAKIGFQLVPEVEVPPFLRERLREYRKTGKDFVCMMRP